MIIWNNYWIVHFEGTQWEPAKKKKETVKLADHDRGS